MFYRGSTAVIAPDLMRDLRLSPESIGVLTGAFFLAFAVMQIPCGLLFDRFGPRRTVPSLLTLAAIGSLVFASAQGMAGLTAGRVLMGLGSAGVLMGSLVVAARWFPLDRYALIASLLIATGGTGNLLATAPLAAAVEAIGWRGAFVGAAVVTGLLCLLGYAAVRDAPPGHPYHERESVSFGEVLRGMREVLANRQLPFIFAANFVTYASVMTVIGLWGGPYLHDVYGLDGVGRGKVLLLMATAVIAGALVYGPLDRLFDTRKFVILGGGGAKLVVLSVLALTPGLELWQVTSLFMLLGVFGGYGVVIMAHGRAIFPERLMGRGITTLNVAVMTGVATMQVATGAIIGAFTPSPGSPAPVEAYRLTFGFLVLVELFALAIYSRVNDAKPSRDARARERTERPIPRRGGCSGTANRAFSSSRETPKSTQEDPE